MNIGRQIKILGIEDYAREKTPKYTEEKEVKAQKRARELVSARYYTDDKSKWQKIFTVIH